MTPYYQEDGCTIYHGDAREVLPLILKKMADAWLEEKLGAEPVAGDLRVPRLRRGGGETPR